jgi:CRP-like cAMP-binding protein
MAAFADRIGAVLARSPHFRELPAATRAALAARCSEQALRDGEFFEGAFAVVLAGALQLSVVAQERATTVGILGRGSFFSIADFVSGALPVQLCRAVGRTSLAVMSPAQLRELAREDPALHALVARLVGMRLNAAVSLLADAMHASLPRRLARRLLAQMLAAGAPAGKPVELPVSQSMLGDLLGVGRSALNEELRLLEHARVLRRAYRRIVVLDPVRLRHIAGRNVAPL